MFGDMAARSHISSIRRSTYQLLNWLVAASIDGGHCSRGNPVPTGWLSATSAPKYCLLFLSNRMEQNRMEWTQWNGTDVLF